MTTPTGGLFAKSTQVKKRARFYLILWGVTTAIGALLTFAAASPSSFAVFALLFIGFPAIGLVLAAINYFKPAKTLEIYKDGFILKNEKDGSMLQSALWTEVSDVTWSPDKRKAGYQAMGGALGGVVGSLIASSLTSSSSDGPRDIFIHAPEKKITLDTSYSNPETPLRSIGVVTRDIWMAETSKALESGQPVTFGKLEVSSAGVRNKNNMLEWNTIREAKYLDDDGQIGIVWLNPKQREQTVPVKLGYRGQVLVDVVNQKVGKKPTGMSGKLGRL
jgi:hypothetical protein